MAHNPEARRGLYRKTRPRPKTVVVPPHQAVASLVHNGLTPFLNRFLEACAVKGLSPRTVTGRERSLHRFIAWCDERGVADPRALSQPLLERYQKHLFYARKQNGEPLSFASQHSLLGALKAFCRWLTRQHYLPANPAAELELPKLSRRLPRVILSVAEVEAILGVVDTTNSYGVRDRAILELLYSSGLRRSELASLSVFDVDFGRATLLVREGKGRRDRLLPLGARAGQWIKRYRDEARPELVTGTDDGTLFLTDYGEPWLNNRLSEMVRKYLYHAGIDKAGACHLFRHAMATHMLDNGADIRFIQAMLGHADLATTQIYTQVSIEKLREIHTATHPAKLSDRKALLAQLAAEADIEADDADH